jgi:hypothetical protein
MLTERDGTRLETCAKRGTRTTVKHTKSQTREGRGPRPGRGRNGKFGPGVLLVSGQACRPFAQISWQLVEPILGPITPNMATTTTSSRSTAAAATTMPITREWDAQSLLADAAGSFFPPVGAGAGCWRQPRRDGRVFGGFGAEAYHHAHLYAVRGTCTKGTC